MKVSAANETDLPGILSLQRKNLQEALSPEEFQKEGFVTIAHDIQILRSMNNKHQHSVLKEGDAVIGYALAMHKSFSHDIPILTPMLARIDKQLQLINPSDPLDYIIMGQICIAKEYRGMGLFSMLYKDLKNRLSSEYEHIITEVDMQNPRSLRAHQKVGFETLEVYKKGGRTWNLIIWNWNDGVDANQEKQ